MEEKLKIREGWFVCEIFQNPLDCSWYCCLCSFHLKRGTGNVCVEINGCALKAVVYKQAPEPTNFYVGLGTEVKLYMHLEKEEE